MKRLFNAESAVSLLVTISLFSLLYLNYSHWQLQHNQQANFLYQQMQALQIAENQIALSMAKMECKGSVEQNFLQFQIYCDDKRVEVHFPLGKIEITKP